MNIAGVPVFVQPYLCEHKFLRWRKPHRKSRIAKKWRKRYGAVYAPCPGKCFKLKGLGYVMCPCTTAAFAKETK